MLSITNINDLREKVVHKEEIKESILFNELTSFCYMISAEDTFDDDWARECRGIVFNRFGKVCGRPLHKFFNVNERDSTQVSTIEWGRVARVMEKRDGSMIHTLIDSPTTYPDRPLSQRVFLKSKKSHSSDVAKMAVEYATPSIKALCLHVAELNCTAIFEFTGPTSRIVIYYPENTLTLLHVRDNVSGRYWTTEELIKLTTDYNVPLVEEVIEFWRPLTSDEEVAYFSGQTTLTRLFDIQKILKAAETREGVEGWVIQFGNDGEMVKLKTQWYLKRHRAMTFLRERDIAALVLEEGLDDLKSMLVGDGINIDQILEIEDRVINDVREIERTVKAIAPVDHFKMIRKDFAIMYKPIAGEYFGLLMDLYTGRTPDYKYFFEKNRFKQTYGLRQLNLVPSVAEAE